MVDIIEETWGEYLLPATEVTPASLPSPDQLRNKILVKVKYVSDDKDGAQSTTIGVSDDDDSILEGVMEGCKKKAERVKAPKIIHRLSCLGIHTRGVTFKSLEQREASMPNHIFSLSEKVALAVQRKTPKAMFAHNRDFLMRTYPHGIRVDSSNFDPVIFWRAGVQVVALNWQSWDVGMILNEGMLAGSDGYILKPKGYRCDRSVERTPDSDVEKEKEIESMTPSKTLDRVAVPVLAAQNLPLLSPGDNPAKFIPYVMVGLHTEPDALAAMVGENVIEVKIRQVGYRAQTEKSKRTSPDFGGEVTECLNVEGVVPELAFLSFVVMSDVVGLDVMVAWACIRLDRLRHGYRFVRLLEKNGMPSRGILLIKTEVTEADDRATRI